MNVLICKLNALVQGKAGFADSLPQADFIVRFRASTGYSEQTWNVENKISGIMKIQLWIAN